jgi:hypothetical protein
MNPLKLLFWVAIGSVLGAALGIAVAWGMGVYSQWEKGMSVAEIERWLASNFGYEPQ